MLYNANKKQNNSKYLDFLFFGNPQIFRFNNFDNEGVCNFNKKIVFKSFSENKEYINLTVNDKQVQILNLNLRTNEENFIIVVPNVKRPVINMLTPFVSEVGARTETFLNNHRCVLENFDTDEKVNNLVNKTNKDQKFFKEHVMIHLYGAASPGPNWEKVKLLHWKDSYR